MSPDVDGVLEVYQDCVGHHIESATLVRFANEPLTRNLDEDERGEMFDLSMTLAFSALARRELCGRWGSPRSEYANTDTFRLFVQGFREGEPGSVAVVARRRGGQVTTGYPCGTYQIIKPHHVNLQKRYLVDARLVASLLSALSSPDRGIYEESVFSFNNANTDSDQMLVQHEIVALVGAFERLTEKSGKAEPLVRAVVDLLRPCMSADRPRHLARINRFEATNGSIDQRSGKRIMSSSVTEAWLRDLYRTRNAFGHGRRVNDRPSLWSPNAHLLLGAYVFPLAVLVRLENHGHYALTQDDKDHIFAIPRLASLRETLRWTKWYGSVWSYALSSAFEELRTQRTVAAMKATSSSFAIERQINQDACIAASACSLLRWLNIKSPQQEELDPIVRTGMRDGKNGFDSLRDALAVLGYKCEVKRYTPKGSKLAGWIESRPMAEKGILISHQVQTAREICAHVTVVFAHDGQWCRADPASGKVLPVNLRDLAANYAGDVAIIA